MTPAHHTDLLGELVCSNSLRSADPLTAVGSLKNEMRSLGSLVLRIADEHRVPAGRSLAVDRECFARALTETVAAHPRIRLERGEVRSLPAGPLIIASGPLTSTPLASVLAEFLGGEALHFYDAIAPIVDIDTLSPGSFFAGSRYDGGDDYLNVPLDEDAYTALVADLVAAPVPRHHAETKDREFFEGCQPVEEIARLGPETLRWGPMKPVGLVDPRTGRSPHAVIQLRREQLQGRLFNLVGFQTQLSIPDQERILRRLPAFRAAQFVRHGSAHRNTFIDAPRALHPDLTCRRRSDMRICGQLAGVEGYLESAACGLMAGIWAARPSLPPPPPDTVLGGLLRYITTAAAPFQPMKANWGVTDELVAPPRKKTMKKQRLSERSAAAIREYRAAHEIA